jgi:alkylhydroperoxidase family enzyme
MRLSEIERGDGVINRLLISLISMVSGTRLPDAARLAFYHKNFFSRPLGAWTHAAMRGPSDWTIGERELMASLIAKWNSSQFCVGAHGAIAAKQMGRSVVDAALSDYKSAPLPPRLITTLSFLETMTRSPNDLTAADAEFVRQSGVSLDAFEDAIAIGAIFAIVTRCADALNFAIPSQREFDMAADMLLKRGYRS